MNDSHVNSLLQKESCLIALLINGSKYAALTYQFTRQILKFMVKKA